MFGLLEAPRLSYGCTLRGLLVFLLLVSQKPPGFRFSYGWILRGPLIFVSRDSLSLPVICMVGLFEAPRFTCGITLRVPPVIAWLDSERHPGFRFDEFSLDPRLSYG